MDVVSDVINSLRFQGSLLCKVEARAPWGIHSPRVGAAAFHVVSRGDCWIRVAGDECAYHLSAGDFVLLPHGSEHDLLDDPASTPVAVDALEQVNGRSWGSMVRAGKEGAPATLLCGHVRFDAPGPNPLLAMFPPLIRIGGNGRSAEPWLDLMLRSLVVENEEAQPGGEAIITRLVEILFVRGVREYMTTLPENRQSWLAALGDPPIARALAAIHRAPGHRWSVASLAGEARMSRSAFAARFQSRVGHSPKVYLTRWRMYRATLTLMERDSNLMQLAESLGYTSETSFSRSFKREIGVSPRAFAKRP